MTPEQVERLTERQVAEVLRLVRDATESDKVAPLSEQVLLSAGDGHQTTGTVPAPRSVHLLVHAGPRLCGYAHLGWDLGGDTGSAEVVVDPRLRRHGTGTALLHALEATLATGTSDGARLQVWSHGDLDAARAFASRDGYSRTRELWQMRRSLLSDAPGLPAVTLPEGLRTRHFVVGHDEEAWLRVNALAFVDHPEQGRITRRDLDQRIAQDWFDPAGLILIEDTRGPAPVLVASHWTKVAAPDAPGVGPSVGEVYVVGVDPAYQGQGLGTTVTVLGLAHLREKGLTQAMLYVDADNLAAVATYSRLDFARSAVDIMYSRIVHPPM
ncbi:MAG: mycothiol synthase [Actinomycetota bacterium]